ncbi:MAG: hypothetical protein R3C17_21850 [Planctomycetaceae bacterium]
MPNRRRENSIDTWWNAPEAKAAVYEIWIEIYFQQERWSTK